MLIFVFVALPTFFIICGICAYNKEKDVSFILSDDSSVQYINGTITKSFLVDDIVEWYRYYSRSSQIEIYELHLRSGEIITFSNMIPLYKYLLKHRKQLGLPPLQSEGSVLRLYMHSAIS